MLPISTRVYAFIFFILLIANVSLYRSFAPKEMRVETIPAGKGSVTLVRTADRRVIVIDAGSDGSVLRALGTTLLPWQRKIDLLVLRGTANKDSGGAPDILARYNVATLARPKTEGTYTWESALAATASADTRVVRIEKGSVLSLGNTTLSITTAPGKTPALITISDGVTAKEIK
jgi:beta-lactamase superfamily II metal-dependent hydrolase